MFHPGPQLDLKNIRSYPTAWLTLLGIVVVVLTFVSASCSDSEKSGAEPYFSGTMPPRKQEFRWSNGRTPKSLDPALAAAPPETDLVRAVYEGLTEIDARTMQEVPAAAESWTPSEDLKTWTFHLRGEARWSSGHPVTAADFVRSWKRLGRLGDSVPHHDLLSNIIGFPITQKETVPPPPAASIVPDPRGQSPLPIPTVLPRSAPVSGTNSNTMASDDPGPADKLLGVSAPDAHTLRVQLIVPDKDFPKLVAHPIFRPVFGDGNDLAANPVGTATVTNGAFRVTAIGPDGVTLDRSETYWNREALKLERVKFVATQNAEQALAAYKAGEIDAVTNADFEPLALKLLEPFEDFRRRPHAAINFYEINHEKPPFDDRRVREALAIAIERERLTEGEMKGLTQPAFSFLPFGSDSDAKIVQDKERAVSLLDEAGFPRGENFPVIKLVVNRNDIQQRVARAVARMWKQNLNVETEIVVKETAELEDARNAGDFDLVRRGVVFPSADELMGILSVLRPAKPATPARQAPASPMLNGVEAEDPPSSRPATGNEGPLKNIDTPDVTMSDANAVYELWAIPLYFPTSYSLVKPYVSGFDMNSLDAPSLTGVAIDSDWQPK